MLFEILDQHAGALKTMGERAIEQANRAGVPAYFMNPSLGEGIIRRMPDGRLERVRLEAGKFIAIETLRLPD
jgi:hypothetical protein